MLRYHDSFGRERKSRNSGCLAVWLFAIVLLRPASGGQAALYVDGAATGPAHDGTTWCTAFVDLQQALAAASQSGGVVTEIRVANGTYRPAGVGGSREASFGLLSGVTILGGHAGCSAPDPDARDHELHPSFLSGDIDGIAGVHEGDAFHVVTASGTNPTAVLDGFTITRGFADGTAPHDRGGALLIEQGTVALIDCRLVDNFAALAGGAIYNDHGSATLTFCLLEGNAAASGGSIFNNGGVATLEDCQLANNSAASPFPADLPGVDIGIGLPPGFETSGIVWHSRLKQLIVVNDNGQLASLDSDGADIQTIELPGDNEGVCVADPATDFVYVGVENPDAIVEFDLSTGEVTRTFDLTPFITGPSNAGLEALTFVTVSGHPEGGLFYAGSQFDGKLYVFELPIVSSPTATTVTHVDTIAAAPGRGEIRGLDYDRAEGVLYAIYTNLDLLRAVKPDGTLVAEWDYPGDYQEGVALGGGSLFIADDQSGGIWRYTFHGTPGTGTAGGIGSVNGSLSLNRCTLVGGAADRGGGIHATATQVDLTNTLFSGNRGGSMGGALHLDGESVTVVNCTLAENEAASSGGLHVAGGTVAVTNSVFRSNRNASSNDEDAQIGGAGVIVNHSSVQGWTGTLGGIGNIDGDPLFADPDGLDDTTGTLDDDLQLGAGSPIIDAGDSQALPPGAITDLLGNPRFVDSPSACDTGVGPPPIVDMGALEFEGTEGCCEGDGCWDGDLCTENDVCAADVCSGSPVDCTDLDNACSVGVCDQDTGACMSVLVVTCDDIDPCTDDSCDSVSGCLFTDNVAACDDGNACTTGDVCGGGVCGGVPLDCEDGDACTDSICVGGVCDGVGICEISGSVLYYRIPGAEPSAKPVPGVELDVNEDDVPDAVTDSDGGYAVRDLSGPFTVSPLPNFGSGGVADAHNGISSLDAAFIAQLSVGMVTFSPLQHVAGEVTGNGVVSSLDAAMVAQVSAGLREHFPVAANSGSDWAYYRCDNYVDEANHNCTQPVYVHDPLTPVVTDSFYAVLYGDVTGNWQAPSSAALDRHSTPSHALLSEDPVEEADRQAGLRLRALNERRVARPREWNVPATLRIADWSGLPGAGERRTLSLEIGDADGIEALDLKLDYDPAQISIVSIRRVGIGVGLEMVTHDVGGTLRISMYGLLPLEGSGGLLSVTVEAQRDLGPTTPLDVTGQANENLIPLRITDLNRRH